MCAGDAMEPGDAGSGTTGVLCVQVTQHNQVMLVVILQGYCVCR